MPARSIVDMTISSRSGESPEPASSTSFEGWLRGVLAREGSIYGLRMIPHGGVT